MPQTPLPDDEPVPLRDAEISWFEPTHTVPLLVEPVADTAAVAMSRRSSVRWGQIRWVEFAAAPPARSRSIAAAPRFVEPPELIEDEWVGHEPTVTERAMTEPVEDEPVEDALGLDSWPTPPIVASTSIGRLEPVAVRHKAAPAWSALAMAACSQLADRTAAVLWRSAASAADLVARGGAEVAAWLLDFITAGIPRAARLGAAAAALGVIAFLAYEGGEHLAGLAGASTRIDAKSRLQTVGLAMPDNGRETGMPADPAQRAASYLDRAKAGDPLAQYNVAVLYARGDGFAQNYATAAGWFRKAAASGNAAAQFNLGVIYERGLGMPANADEAMLWYRRAADRNYAAAQYNLAIAYAEGRGTPQDRVAAARWYHQAAVRGLVPAMVNFAILYEKGEGVERSLPDAFSWYRAAAQRGDAVSEKRASELLRQFVGSDRRQAESLATAIADSIRPPAAERLPGAQNRADAEALLKSGNWVFRPVRYEH